METPLMVPGNMQHQNKNGLKFSVKDHDVIYDWYNSYFWVEYHLQKLVDRTAIWG